MKLFCAKCGSREAFRPVHCTDVTNELRQPRPGLRLQAPPAHIQIFVLTFQCQACMSPPTTILVRREGWDLMLEGRSPIEHVEVPGFIPKAERNYFRDALIASQTGKTLAALFYPRTFIERFARRQTGIDGRETGDKIMEAYQKTLPPNLRDLMPSLGHWYDQLSEALHAAREDEKLFEEARVEIERHFEMRRIHKVGDAQPAAAEPAAATEPPGASGK